MAQSKKPTITKAETYKAVFYTLKHLKHKIEITKVAIGLCKDDINPKMRNNFEAELKELEADFERFKEIKQVI